MRTPDTAPVRISALAGLCLPIPTGAAERAPLEYVVLEEHGKQELPAKPGQNIRMINTNNLHGGDSIKFDEGSGYLTLAPGT